MLEHMTVSRPSSEVDRWVTIIRHSNWISIFIIVREDVETQKYLFLVANALDASRLFFSFTKGGQEHASQDGDDGDHDEQLD